VTGEPNQIPDELPATGLREAGARPEPDLVNKIAKEGALAFSHGLRDAMRGVSRVRNPYPPGTLDSKAWAAGWFLIHERGPPEDPS